MNFKTKVNTSKNGGHIYIIIIKCGKNPNILFLCTLELEVKALYMV